jgi:hypothetical protein
MTGNGPLWMPITRQGCLHRTGASLAIGRQVIGDHLIDPGASIAVAEGLDMNKHPFPAVKRRDESESLVIVAGYYFAFSGHVLCPYNAMHQKRRAILLIPVLTGKIWPHLLGLFLT